MHPPITRKLGLRYKDHARRRFAPIPGRLPSESVADIVGIPNKAIFNTRSETAMNNHSKQRLLFKDIGGKKVEADFLGGEVTSDAGLLLFREVDRTLRLTERIAPLLRERRDVRYTDHSTLDLLRRRVFQIVAGYEDADAADTLRNDPALKMACERTPDGPALASQPTFSRCENSVTRSDLYRFSAMLLDVFIDSYRKPPKGIILDIDDTADETHGHQQLSLFTYLPFLTTILLKK
jgi:hypothetical protein